MNTKFLRLPSHRQHKLAALALRNAYAGTGNEGSYRELESLLLLEPIPFEFEDVSNRYHLHMRLAHTDPTEIHLLSSHVRHLDRISTTPFQPIAIYLDNLRSAYNVGSIIRTTEALRLGEIFFGTHTPFIDNPKVQKTAMGTGDIVPCHRSVSLDALPRPFIALETADDAVSLNTFTFPRSFTLIVGNEEFGVSKELLACSDHIVEIPLLGSKNSINVAAAFSIAAYQISLLTKAVH